MPRAKTTSTKTRKSKISLKLTKPELVHLRDLMSIYLPHNTAKTVSMSLAERGKNQIKEDLLWKKIAKLCKDNNIVVAMEAPDFFLDFAAPPVIEVFSSSDE